MQGLDADYCGPFQMFFYLNLFEPLETSIDARATSKKLTDDLIGELLNEIFVIETKHNERMLDSFILQNDIEFAESSELLKFAKWTKIIQTLNVCNFL